MRHGLVAGILLVLLGPALLSVAAQEAPRITSDQVVSTIDAAQRALAAREAAAAQGAPRLTGDEVVSKLDTAQQDLVARAASLPGSSLLATSQHLAAIAADLRKTLGKDAAKPVDLIGLDAKGSAYRANALVLRTRAYLETAKSCSDSDARAMADALAATVDAVNAVHGGSKTQPIIDGVETADHRPLFVLRNSSKDIGFALVGANLFDAQCENPLVTATDAKGKLQAVQPAVTGLQPGRIELKLADASTLSSGSYVLHVASKRKAFLVGCTSQPEAVAAVQVAAAGKISVSYAVAATCQVGAADQVMPPVTGTFPDLSGTGTVSRQVEIGNCANPVSYAITAKTTFADGHVESVGPISQIASAGISAGLPGGYSLSWDPSVRQLFVRPPSGTCKGVY